MRGNVPDGSPIMNYTIESDRITRRITLTGPRHIEGRVGPERFDIIGPSCEPVNITATDRAAARSIWLDFLIHHYGLCAEQSHTIAREDFS